MLSLFETYSIMGLNEGIIAGDNLNVLVFHAIVWSAAIMPVSSCAAQLTHCGRRYDQCGRSR